MSFVDVLFETLRALSPILVIRTKQRGVLYRLGQVRAQPLHPGVHWRVPYLREIEVISMQIQWADVPVQGVATSDGLPIALSVNVAYEVVDAIRWQVAVADSEHAILNALRPAVASTISQYEYEVMYTRLPALSRLLRAKSRYAVEHLGARIVEIGITDFVQTRHYRVLQDTIVS